MPTSLSRSTLCGVWPALIIPWMDNERLDEKRFRQEIRSYGGSGVNGLYTGGTTGEFYAQDDATFEVITNLACEEAHALGLQVQIGCTALSTRTVGQRVRWAVEAGADGIQIALPFWLEVKDDETFAFFCAVAEEADSIPLILYHTSRAKRRLPPDLLGEIARNVPTFIGLKDTGCDVALLKAILSEAPDLAVFGSEQDLIEKTQAGGRGTYSSMAGLNVRRIVELFELCVAGRYQEACVIQDEIQRLMSDVLLPMVENEGLMDSAVDRVQRIVGGVDIGLRCASPYRSATEAHVRRVAAWCSKNAPLLWDGRAEE